MGAFIDDSKPIYAQIAEHIEDEIIRGELAEESQVPSTNQFAVFYQINPATAAKGVNLLVDQGILYKKRGIGMFVKQGARETLMAKRRDEFYEEYVAVMLQEAKKIGITQEQLTEMIQRGELNR